MDGDMKPAAPVYPLPFRRELLDVAAWYDSDGHLIIQLMCDCAVVTEATILDEQPPGEFAVSCHGCHTSHWITVSGGGS